MEKNMSAIFGVCLVAILLLTGGFSYLVGTQNAESKVITEYIDKEVEVEVEVEKLVNVSVFDPSLVLDESIDLFIEEVEDEEDLQRCKREEYDEDQIMVKRVYEDYSIKLDEDIMKVLFSVRLKYLDDDVEEKCYRTYDVKVVYEDGEDTELKYSLA